MDSELTVFGEEFKNKNHKYFQYVPRLIETRFDGWKITLGVAFTAGMIGDSSFKAKDVVAQVYQDMEDFSANHYYSTFEVNIMGGQGLEIECVIRGGTLL